MRDMPCFFKNATGGTIEVHSEVDVGSRFDVTLTLPVDQSAAREVPAKGVLLVSEDAVLVRNAESSMRQANVPFRAVSTEAEAAALVGLPFDVVLLAGRLDAENLGDAIRRLRTAAKEEILIFCCDYAEREKVLDTLKEANVDGLIARPFFLSNLIAAIEQVHENVPVEECHSILRGMRFLCAEDNELNAEILKAVLEVNDAACDIYPDGAKLVEAFRRVQPGDYDAILMDVQMPNMNGLEATHCIRTGANPLGKTIPIIAMTANAFAEDVQACLDAGMNAHVSKPLDIGTLERALKGTGKFSGGHLCAARRRNSNGG